MKKGKTVKINQYESIKTQYGTVDSKQLKSLYINMQTWVAPKVEMENWDRIVGGLSRNVKHSVYKSINRELFAEKFIVDFTLIGNSIGVTGKNIFKLLYL